MWVVAKDHQYWHKMKVVSCSVQVLLDAKAGCKKCLLALAVCGGWQVLAMEFESFMDTS